VLTFLYWRHKTTGTIYAVRIAEDGVLDGAYGPIPRKKATPAKLPYWSFSSVEGSSCAGGSLSLNRSKRNGREDLFLLAMLQPVRDDFHAPSYLWTDLLDSLSRVLPSLLLRTPRLGHRGYTLPEIVERDTVEERRGLDDLVIAQLQKPRIGVAIGLSVTRRALHVEVDDHCSAVGIDIADRRDEPT